MKRTLALLTILLAAFACKPKAVEQDRLQLMRPVEDWTADAVVYELNTRQATAEGTLAAAEKKLPELKELGVDVVWLMPIYPIGVEGRKGTLGSYYAIKDYCDVNPEFGTLEDFDRFVETAHGLGLKVILDWVANHTSPDHPWVTEKDPSWYVRDSVTGKTIVEYDWTDIAKLNYANAEMRDAMASSMRFWLDRGIDGFRCDVAFQVPQDFWSDVFTAFRQEYPRRLFFLAEGEETFLHDAGFDCTYAWKLHHLLNDIAQGKADGDSLVSYLAWNKENYGGAHRLMFTSNHDENSWNGTEYERMGDAWQAMSVLCWTLPGSQPLIYTGQEVGLNHRFEFFEKDPMPDWHHNATTDFYAYLTGLKHSHKALRSDNPAIEIISATDSDFVFKRFLDEDTVTVSVGLKAPWKSTNWWYLAAVSATRR